MTKRHTLLWRTVSEKFSSHLSIFSLTSIDLRLYKYLQWHCFNWPILRLCTHVHGQGVCGSAAFTVTKAETN